jgi:predicted homoserine dehydrogenase-like protein
LGDGPYFALYRPFHLASVEAPLTVAEMVLDGRPSLVTEHWTAEVGAAAKRDLKAGEKIDGVGGSMVRGNIDDADDFKAAGFAPFGVLAGATVVRDVAQGEMLTYDDVQLDEGSTIVCLRRLQDKLFA